LLPSLLEDPLDLKSELLLLDRVHSSSRTREPAVPRRKRLSKAQRFLNAKRAHTLHTNQSSLSKDVEQPGCAPVSGTRSVPNLGYIELL
jgi:hypothetical protein